MKRAVAPTHAEFDEEFRDAIRGGFNWDRFLDEQWPIERVVVDSKEQLGRCFTPWYIGLVGDQVAYDDPASAPMSVADVPKAMPVLSEERKADILDKIASFCGEDGTIRFVAATYGLPDGNFFVMDRNHRLAALVFCDKPFKVELWNVRGPFETDALMDLHYWVRNEEA
jgi:hypothetical protein